MEVVVDLRTGAVAVAEPIDLQHFSVVAVARAEATVGDPTIDPAGDDPSADAASTRALAEALRQSKMGEVQPDGSALVDPDGVRRLATAGNQLPDDWDAEFASMLAYAASRGWIADDGSIRAHVEWKVDA